MNDYQFLRNKSTRRPWLANWNPYNQFWYIWFVSRAVWHRHCCESLTLERRDSVNE